MSARDIKTIPEAKKKLVKELAEKMKSSKTTLVASIKGLPSKNFQDIKKILRGKGEVRVAKKSAILRAIKDSEKGALQNLKERIGADMSLIFSEMDAFELSGLLSDNQSPAKAKAGDKAPEDIDVEPGPTDLIPGPAISELGAVGLKVAVENGKLAIKNPKTLVKGGEEIDDKVASVLGKLGIEPMKVGIEPVAAYDAGSDKSYFDIKIDKKGTLESLREVIGKSFGFAVGVGFVNSESVKYFISKAGLEEKALAGKVESGGSAGEESKDEGKKEEESSESDTADEKSAVPSAEESTEGVENQTGEVKEGNAGEEEGEKKEEPESKEEGK